MQRLNSGRFATWTVLMWAAVAVGIGGCDTADETTAGPADREVRLRDIGVTPMILTVGEVAIVEALVTDADGNGLSGELVRFSVTPVAGGSFDASFYQTGPLGIAVAAFTAARAGEFTITAQAVANPTSQKTATVTIEEPETTGPSGITMSLTADPSLMPAGESSTSTITVEITDAADAPIEDGTIVKFVAGEKFEDVDGDGLWTDNVDQLIDDVDGDGEWDANGTFDDPVTATVNGMATATYTASNRPGHVHVKVTAGEPGSATSGDVSIILTPADPVHTIALTPEWQRIQVRGTGGVEWAQVTAQLYDQHGNAVVEGVPVAFSITNGPGGGENLNGDAAGPVSVLTNSLGQATVTFNAGTIPGTAFIRARVGTVMSEATQITIRSGPAAFIAVGADSCNIGSWEYVNWKNTIAAVAYDIWGNEVPDSTAIWFGCEQGLIEGAAETQVAFSERGEAHTVWHSAFPKDDPYVFFWAQTAGGTVADTSFFIESGPSESGTFLQYPDTLFADGVSNGRVTIEVLDVNGVFMVNGKPITVEAELGTIESGLLADGCHSSTYIGRYFAPTLDRDHVYTVPGDGIGAIDVISAYVDGTAGFYGEVVVVLRTGPSFSETCEILAPTSMRYGSTIPVEVLVRDRWENPLGGHQIQVSADPAAGTISGSPQITDAFGLASGFTFTATTNVDVKTAMITATDVDPNYGGMSVVTVISLQE
ncbi:MAG: hypothetical protein Kow0074_17050 [Candidatus Zixiibacteriota bacterium]